jgi:hypothetical protein
LASTPAPRSALVIYLLAGFAALVVGVGVVRERSSLPEAHVVNRPVRIPQDGYVSSDACQACHPSQYASWRASYHRTMTQVATPESAIPRFDGIEVSGVHGRAMRLSRRGRELLAEFDDPDASANPEERPRIERAVVMITGSHHQQIFWYATGHDRLLGQLPGAYLVREAQWIPRRSAVLHPPTEPPLPCDERPHEVRYAVRIATGPLASRRYDGGRARHLVRSVSRSEPRARTGQPIAAPALRIAPPRSA